MVNDDLEECQENSEKTQNIGTYIYVCIYRKNFYIFSFLAVILPNHLYSYIRKRSFVRKSFEVETIYI